MAWFKPRYRPQRVLGQSAASGGTDRYFMPDQLDRNPRMRRISQREEAFVRRVIDCLPAGATVADVPAGNGRMSQWVVARQDLSLVALDLNFPMLRSMERRGIPAMLARRVRADVMRLPLPDRSVDLVINMRLMHHLSTEALRLAMLSELARVTRDRAVVTFFSTHAWRYVRRRLIGKEIRGFPISPAEFRRLCSQCDLVVEELAPVRPWYEEQCLALCRRG